MHIVKYPDPVLTRIADPVPEDDLARIAGTAREMFEQMYRARGVGLAAPQVGISQRFFVVNVGERDGNGAPKEYVFVNPEILETDGEQLGEEGCLSIPGVMGKVQRANRVKVRALDEHGKPFELEATGYLARAIQHETDHIDGRLFLEHISDTERAMAEPRLKELRRDYEARVKKRKAKERKAKAKEKRRQPRPRR